MGCEANGRAISSVVKEDERVGEGIEGESGEESNSEMREAE